MDNVLKDLYIRAKTTENERLALDRQSKLLKVEEDNLKAQVLEELHKLGLDHVDYGDLGSARIERKVKPYIADFTALEGYIVEHRATDLLQKRLTESAVKLRWDDGIVIPGIGVSEEEKLQLR